jgi:hypothetical protein
VGRSEERFSHGRTPVDQQLTTRAVPQSKPSDVGRLGTVCPDNASKTQVQTEPTKSAEPSGQPVDLQIPVERLLADAGWRLPLGFEAVGQVGDRLLEALRDGLEVMLVDRDQRRVGLDAEAVGKVKCAGNRYPISAGSGLGLRLCGMTRVLPQALGCAID